MKPQELMQCRIRDLGKEINDLNARLKNNFLPRPNGYVQALKNPYRRSDFNRVDWSEVPVKLKAINRGTSLNAIFMALSKPDEDHFQIEELRITIEEAKKLVTMLVCVNTEVGNWNLLMMQSAVAFADLAEPNTGIPDSVIQRFMDREAMAVTRLGHRPS